MEKIQIVLDLDPEIALLLAMLINTSSQGEMSVYRMMQPVAKNKMRDIAQKISDQVALKTKFPDNEVMQEVKTFRQEKIGRNEQCYCGSGKKYKHCHGKDIN